MISPTTEVLSNLEFILKIQDKFATAPSAALARCEVMVETLTLYSSKPRHGAPSLAKTNSSPSSGAGVIAQYALHV